MASPNSVEKLIIQEIDSELARLGQSDALKRKLRDLQLRWHPDKNPEEPQKAQVIFEYVQSLWERNFRML